MYTCAGYPMIEGSSVPATVELLAVCAPVGACCCCCCCCKGENRRQIMKAAIISATSMNIVIPPQMYRLLARLATCEHRGSCLVSPLTIRLV